MASNSADFVKYCCELMSSLGVLTSKRMFGGYGLSIEGINLAFVGDMGQGEKLWLKGDAATHAQYLAAGSQIFTYTMRGKEKTMNYFSAPDEAMESLDAMRPWARLALECALKARNGQKPRSNASKAPKTLALSKKSTSKIEKTPAKHAQAAPKKIVK